MTKLQKRLNIACWLIYLIAVSVSSAALVLKMPLFGWSTLTHVFITNTLLILTVFLSLSILKGFRLAFFQMIYWITIIIVAEKTFMLLGQHSFNREGPTIFGDLPIDILLTWFTPIFTFYTLSNFAVSRLSFKRPQSRLLALLSIDIFWIIIFWVLNDPIGIKNGFWSFKVSEHTATFYGAPFYLILEYIVLIIIINFPFRWYETYKTPIKDDLYYNYWISYPLYFGWSFFLALTLRQFGADLIDLGWFGATFVVLLTGFSLWKKRKYRNEL